MSPKEKRWTAIIVTTIVLVVGGLSYWGFADEDEDGYVRWLGMGSDCEDGYSARTGHVYPGAPEICDGRDNDCDGEVDEGHAVHTWCPDNDDDGYGANHGTEVEPALFQGCARLTGWGYGRWAPNCNDPDDTDPGATPE